MRLSTLCTFSMLLTTTSGYAQTHNIRADSVLSPSPGRTPAGIAISVAARFTNTGVTERSFPVAAWIRDPPGNVVYRDTLNIPTLLSGARIDTSWVYWTPTSTGIYTVCAGAFLPTDEVHSDDTFCSTVLVLPMYDADADSVIFPKPNMVIAQDSTWRPVALFSSVGVSDLFDVPVFAVIYPIAVRVPVFISDTTIPALNINQGLVSQTFRPDVGTYHISRLQPGCYMLAVIAKYPGDGDHLNDTAWAPFCISSSGVSDTRNFEALKMFPNPAAQSILIENLPAKTDRVVISNVLGQQEFEEPNPDESSLSIDISKLPAGMYFVCVESTEGVVTKCLLKE